MAEVATSRLVRNPAVLEEGYIPDELPERTHQISLLRASLSPIFNHRPARTCLLTGETGSGKTLAAKFVLREFGKTGRMHGVYLNGWEHTSSHSILSSIISRIRPVAKPAAGTTMAAIQLKRLLMQKSCVVVLDDIDKLSPKVKNFILYILSTIKNLGLVCIAEKPQAVFNVPQAVLSRLTPKHILFHPYQHHELVEILERRAQEALIAGAWTRGVLVAIARSAAGDARVSLGLLRESINQAEALGQKRINGVANWQENLATNGEMRAHARLQKLGWHYTTLYEIIKRSPGIISPNLWKEYLASCKKERRKNIALRTFHHYLEKLIGMGLIISERAPIRGNVRRLNCSSGK